MYSQLLISYPQRRGTLRMADVVEGDAAAQLRRRVDDAIAAGCLHLEVDGSRVVRVEREALATLSAAQAYLTSVGGALTVSRPSGAFVRAAERAGLPALVRRPGTVHDLRE